MNPVLYKPSGAMFEVAMSVTPRTNNFGISHSKSLHQLRSRQKLIETNNDSIFII